MLLEKVRPLDVKIGDVLRIARRVAMYKNPSDTPSPPQYTREEIIKEREVKTLENWPLEEDDVVEVLDIKLKACQNDEIGCPVDFLVKNHKTGRRGWISQPWRECKFPTDEIDVFERLIQSHIQN